MIKHCVRLFASLVVSTGFAAEVLACMPPANQHADTARDTRPILLRVTIEKTYGIKGEFFGTLYEHPTKITVNVVETIRGPAEISGRYNLILPQPYNQWPYTIIELKNWAQRTYSRPENFFLENSFVRKIGVGRDEFIAFSDSSRFKQPTYYVWALSVNDGRINILETTCNTHDAFFVPNYVVDYANSKGLTY